MRLLPLFLTLRKRSRRAEGGAPRGLLAAVPPAPAARACGCTLPTVSVSAPSGEDRSDDTGASDSGERAAGQQAGRISRSPRREPTCARYGWHGRLSGSPQLLPGDSPARSNSPAGDSSVMRPGAVACQGSSTRREGRIDAEVAKRAQGCDLPRAVPPSVDAREQQKQGWGARRSISHPRGTSQSLVEFLSRFRQRLAPGSGIQVLLASRRACQTRPEIIPFV